eukprot:867238-Alexandrium_andersonii.AAC.1
MVEESVDRCEGSLQADSRGHTASERPLGSRIAFRKAGPVLHGSQPAAERHLRRMLRRAHETAW